MAKRADKQKPNMYVKSMMSINAPKYKINVLGVQMRYERMLCVTQNQLYTKYICTLIKRWNNENMHIYIYIRV